MTGPVAFLNGRFVPFAGAGLALHDAGFVAGATVVDNARTYGRRLFRWADHLARFRRDCAACYVPLLASDADLTRAADELVSRNAALLPPGGELQLVTFATPGPLGFYVGDPANGPPTLGMATYPLPPRYERFVTDGVTLALAGVQGGAEEYLLPPRVKHRSRLFWHVAERTVNDPTGDRYRPGAVPVVVTEAGVGDTAIGALLAVVGGAVRAAAAGAVQESITVKVVAELCAALGVPFAEAPLDVRPFARPSDDPDGPTELLLAGTGFGVAPVREFAERVGVARAFACPGPVYARLRAGWEALTAGA